jgi:hypothetical protein
VGQGAWEEISVVPASAPAGQNLGWNVLEGAHCYGAATCDMAGKLMPVHEYPHGVGNCVTGGYVYRGCSMPDLHGTYVFADYSQRWIRTFRWSEASGVTDVTTPEGLPQVNVSSFGEDAYGELYLVAIDGDVYRLVPR